MGKHKDWNKLLNLQIIIDNAILLIEIPKKIKDITKLF